MTNIQHIAPLSEFLQAETDGWITLRSHNLDQNLVIANYTPAQTFRRAYKYGIPGDESTRYSVNAWDTVTLSARGLIFHKNSGEIVARPMSKFFNFGQSEAKHVATDGPIEVTEKEDGSMGVLYMAPDGRYAVSTRGSMHSDQAEHATALYRATYDFSWVPDEDYTFIFEIIYPEGRIVLDYGEMDDLILIAAVNKETGRSANREQLVAFGYPGPIVPIYNFPTFASVFEAEQESGHEGFVVRFVDSDERLKIKFDDYIALHKLMFGLSRKAVWEVVSSDIEFDTWLTQFPDEFTTDIRTWETEFNSKHDEILSESQSVFSELTHLISDRRAFAQELKSRNTIPVVKALVFGMADDRSDEFLSATIWKNLRP
jgi:RNA ligase